MNERVLFVTDKSVDMGWLAEVIARVSARLSKSMGRTITVYHKPYEGKAPPFATYKNPQGETERWIPFSWLRDNLGPLTQGERMVMLCLGKRNWPSNSIVLGRVEYAPYNGVTYLSHMKAVKGEKIRRGETKYDLAEDSLFHELLHTYEAQLGKFGIVHSSVNNLDAAAMALSLLLKAAEKPVPVPQASPATIAIYESLKARIAALTRPPVVVPVPSPKPMLYVPLPLPAGPRIPNGLRDIKAVFGDFESPGWEEKNIKLFPLPYQLTYLGQPVNRSRAHVLLIPRLQWIFSELKRRGLSQYVQSYGGCYERRTVRGSSFPSTHSWGISIDIEPEKYPLGSTKRLPNEVIAVFREAGFMYGGDFPGRKDPQHFQACTGY